MFLCKKRQGSHRRDLRIHREKDGVQEEVGYKEAQHLKRVSCKKGETRQERPTDEENASCVTNRLHCYLCFCPTKNQGYLYYMYVHILSFAILNKTTASFNHITPSLTSKYLISIIVVPPCLNACIHYICQL